MGKFYVIMTRREGLKVIHPMINEDNSMGIPIFEDQKNAEAYLRYWGSPTEWVQEICLTTVIYDSTRELKD